MKQDTCRDLTTMEHVTRRQNRLLAWMLAPRTVPAEHRAIDWGAAAWSADELVALTGFYPTGRRHACLADLHALRRLGQVEGGGRQWWVNPAYRAQRVFNLQVPW